MKPTKTFECPICYYARIVSVAVFAVFLTWVLMTEWFTATCTGVCATAISVLVMPATLIATAVGDDSGEVVGTYFSIGMIFQVLGVYLLVDRYIEKKRDDQGDE